jgi:hypothetical protein
MIDPSRFAEDMATYPGFVFPEPAFSNPVQRKTDSEAIEDWEDEGGASGPGKEVKEAARCD